MPTRGQQKRWFWRCTYERASGDDYEECQVGCRKRDGFPTEAEAAAAGRRHELEWGDHKTMTWSDFVKPIKKVKTKAQPSKKKQALTDLIVSLKSVFEMSAVIACWHGKNCDAGPDCEICRDMKEVRRLLKVLGDMA
jgi:hypothetical protein